jgi:hypothetical protein
LILLACIGKPQGFLEPMRSTLPLIRRVKSLGKVGIGGGASRQGRQLGPAETLPTYRAQIDGSSKMMIQEIMHQEVTVV